MLEKNDVLILRNKHKVKDIQPRYLGDWELGRQQALYIKARATIPHSFLLEMNNLFIKYNSLDTWHIKVQSDIPLHEDSVPYNILHYRYNITYKGDYLSNIGDKTYLLTEGDSILFRSDISEHGLDLIEKNPVEIFSIGIFIERDNS